ncbi:MAG: DUF448 domain-containing protein [Erythrobacter sp.]|nr:DUF448 domain-containing protein [Erythrobacter sp.]
MRTPNNERLASQTNRADPVSPPDGSGTGKAARNKRKASERRCILAGESSSRGGLIRLAVSPCGLVLPDVQAKAPGRGAWIGVTRAELEAAMEKGRLKAALSRAFRTGDLEIPADLPEKIENALARVLLDRLGLELRAGSLILGTQRIVEAARGGAVALLFHAEDASEDGRKKLDQAWRVGSEREGSGDRGMVLPLDRMALSVALGRENAVHLAVGHPAAAARIAGLLQRLVHFAGGATSAAAADTTETNDAVADEKADRETTNTEERTS